MEGASLFSRSGIARLLLVVLLAALAHGYMASLSGKDMARAYMPKPLPASHVIGGSPSQIFAAMNKHLRAQPHPHRACESFTLSNLDDIARVIWSYRSSALSDIYDSVGDKRSFHFSAADTGLAYKEKLWAEEAHLLATNPKEYGPGTAAHTLTRDGKCAEVVMWWVHHLTEESRTKLAGYPGFEVPLLPAHNDIPDSVSPADSPAAAEYVYQVSCSDCHSTGDMNGKHTVVKPHLRPTTAVDGVAPGTCAPASDDSDLPSVWYQPMSAVGKRKKRCDWDYDPPCQLCEGIGGYSWGDQEDEIRYTNCTPVATPDQIPADSRTSPVWPKAFAVDEVTVLINQINTGGQFPGADPCAAHKFANDTERLYFDDTRVNFDGPVMYTKASKTTIWTLPTADMFIKIDGVFCICVTPMQNGDRTAVPTGPLQYDFARDSVLIGREMIGVEGINEMVLADHYNKGPHHFWISVETGLMVRGWQPYNGLNIYKPGTWEIGAMPASTFAVDTSCYEGPLHRNISCQAGYPSR